MHFTRRYRSLWAAKKSLMRREAIIQGHELEFQVRFMDNKRVVGEARSPLAGVALGRLLKGSRI